MKANAFKDKRAGIIPYTVTDGNLEMYFMVPSDPRYGGSAPQIAKGGVDEGETEVETAIREGEEELGLRRSNCTDKPVLVGIHGNITVYAVEVRSQDAFDDPHYETGETLWLTPDEFQTYGRKDQRAIVAKFVARFNR